MRRTLLMALVLGLVALAAGVFVTMQTFPSDEEIQRLSFEELGLDSAILDNPIVAQILEETVGPVRERVLEESRQSMYLGGGAMVLVTVLGVAVIASDHRRRGTARHEPVAAA
jgi:ABC-type Fe3+ transport system permease subunit